LFLFPHSFIYL